MQPDELKRLRAQYRMSQVEFAQLVGISRSYLSQLEAGLITKPSQRLLNHLELLRLKAEP